MFKIIKIFTLSEQAAATSALIESKVISSGTSKIRKENMCFNICIMSNKKQFHNRVTHKYCDVQG